MLTNEIDKNDFYQSKYEYYSRFTFFVVVLSCLTSTTYFVSDCQLFGRFAIETLVPRTIILIPMCIFIWLQKRLTSYKQIVPIAYIMIHMIMWNTIWAIVYLPDKTHASEGFIIMHLMFFAMGFCAPFAYATVAHVLVIANILISYQFNHYENLDIMLSLGIPCVVGICAIHYCMEKLYVTHYQTTKKLEYISLYDALTGVYNRNILSRLIDAETGQFVERMGNNISIMLLDIDWFKNVNDTYGHVKGDFVLKKTAEVISSRVKPTDYMIRWGGEEFIVILTDTSFEDARVFAEAARKSVEKSENGICPVTISIGLGRYNGNDYKAAVDEADHALYHAKKMGRNRVEALTDDGKDNE